ncbi:DNA polymerase Y family protein [Aestuariispira ectoiniformans]|uniref:DNA polymerase Y family protein n=1 Tax=Aestuariispira ectoiniformans TaxID=2775080 RepID=UPI00223C0F51|nr:DNA polymerase Y family protein [Aestuariispira ectoiniformans]
MTQRFLYIWLPRLATDRYIRKPPPHETAERLRTQPFAVTRTDANTVRLVGVNKVALRQNLLPGMLLADARAIQPALITLSARRDEDFQTLHSLSRWADRYAPWVAVETRPADLPDIGDGGLWLNITGCAHLFGGEQAMLKQIIADSAQFGFDCRLGLADTTGAAWAIARYDETGDLLEAGQTRTGLEPLPLEALRLNANNVQLLNRLGLHRVGDLYPLPRANLTARAGGQVLRRLDQALGRLPEHLAYNQPPQHHCRRQPWPEPLGDGAILRETTRPLLEQLCTELKEQDKGIRQLVLRYRRVDNSVALLTVSTSTPTVSPDHLQRLLDERLPEIDPGFGVDETLAWARRIDPLATRQTDMETAESAGDQVALGALVDRLSHRMGPNRIHRPGFKESHRPERLYRPQAPFGKAQDSPWPTLPPRPLRLFDRPEPVTVETSPGQTLPKQFIWRRVCLQAQEVTGPERIGPEWWRQLGDKPLAGTRDYFRVRDQKGRRLWLCRERAKAGENWFIHGIFG